MKKLTLGFLILAQLFLFSGCDSSRDTQQAPNNNSYNLQVINKTTGIYVLLQGGYSNGVKESFSLIRLDESKI